MFRNAWMNLKDVCQNSFSLFIHALLHVVGGWSCVTQNEQPRVQRKR